MRPASPRSEKIMTKLLVVVEQMTCRDVEVNFLRAVGMWTVRAYTPRKILSSRSWIRSNNLPGAVGGNFCGLMSTVAAAVAATTTPAGAFLFPWPGFVHGEGSTLNFFTIQSFYRLISRFIIGHLHESEAF